MPRVLDTDNIKWEIDSADPTQVDLIDPSSPEKLYEKRKHGFFSKELPCLKNTLQLGALVGGVVGVSNYLLTSRGKRAARMGFGLSVAVFLGSYSLCYSQYRKRLLLAYQSDLFRPGHEDEYIT